MDFKYLGSFKESDASLKKNVTTDTVDLKQEVIKLSQVNQFLQDENNNLRAEIFSIKDSIKNKGNITKLEEKYGYSLANAFERLIDENKRLKSSFSRSLRGEARKEANNAQLVEYNDVVRQQLHNLSCQTNSVIPNDFIVEDTVTGVYNNVNYAGGMLEEEVDVEQGGCRKNKCLEFEEYRPLDENRQVNASFKRQCRCTEKLDELLNLLDEKLCNYERFVWQSRISSIEAERDDLEARNMALNSRICEMQAKLMCKPFLSDSLKMSTVQPNKSYEHLQELHKRLSLAETANIELQKRLAFEKNISRTWQVNLRALQRELRDHLADMMDVCRSTGPLCEVFRGIMNNLDHPVNTSERATKGEKESIRLMRLAKNRIEADAKRMEMYAKRVRDLESEVASLRISCSEIGSYKLMRFWSIGKEEDHKGRSFSVLKQSELYFRDDFYSRKVLRQIRTRIKEIDYDLSNSLVEKYKKKWFLKKGGKVWYDYMNKESLSQEEEFSGGFTSGDSIFCDYSVSRNLDVHHNMSEGCKEGVEVESSSLCQMESLDRLSSNRIDRNFERMNVLSRKDRRFLRDSDEQHEESRKCLKAAKGRFYPKNEKSDSAFLQNVNSEDIANYEAGDFKQLSDFQALRVAKQLERTESCVKTEAQLGLKCIPAGGELEGQIKTEAAGGGNVSSDNEATRSMIVVKEGAGEGIGKVESVTSKEKVVSGGERTELIERREKQGKQIDMIEANREKIEILVRKEAERCLNVASQSKAREIERLSKIKEEKEQKRLEEINKRLMKMEEYIKKRENEQENYREEFIQMMNQLKKKEQQENLQVLQFNSASQRSADHNFEKKPLDTTENKKKEECAPSHITSKACEKTKSILIAGKENLKEDDQKEKERNSNKLHRKLSEETRNKCIDLIKQHLRNTNLTLAELHRKICCANNIKNSFVDCESFVAYINNEEVKIPEEWSTEFFYVLSNGKSTLDMKCFYSNVFGCVIRDAHSLGSRLKEVFFSLRNAFKIEGLTENNDEVKECHFVSLCERVGVSAESAHMLFNKLREKPNTQLIVNNFIKYLSDSERDGEQSLRAVDSPGLKNIVSSRNTDVHSISSKEEKVFVKDVPKVVKSNRQAGRKKSFSVSCHQENILKEFANTIKEEKKEDELQPKSLSSSASSSSASSSASSASASSSASSASASSSASSASSSSSASSASSSSSSSASPSSSMSYHLAVESTDAIELTRDSNQEESLENNIQISEGTNDSETCSSPLELSQKDLLNMEDVEVSKENEEENKRNEPEDYDLEEISPSRPKVETSSKDLKEILKDRIIDKYGTCANAFRFMDENANGTVTIHEFANFLEETGFDLTFNEVLRFYNELSQPIFGILTLPCLYKNIEGDLCTISEFNRRLEEIYANTAVPFEELSITETSYVTANQFVEVANKIGVSSSHALNLWDSIDILNTGKMMRSNVLLYLADDVDLEEIKRSENEASYFLNSVIGFIGGTKLAMPKPKPRTEIKEEETKPMDQEWKLQNGLQLHHVFIDNFFEFRDPWRCLRLEQRKILYENMEEINNCKADTILVDIGHIEAPLIFLQSGKINLLAENYLYRYVEESVCAPSVLYEEEFLNNSVVTKASVVANEENEISKKTDAHIWKLSKSVYKEKIENLLSSRLTEVSDIQTMMDKVAILHKLTSAEKRRLASTFRTRKFLSNEIIIQEFDEPDYFYLVKKGKAVVIKFLEKDVDPEEVKLYQTADYFGEVSLIENQTRTATVMAKTDCEVLYITQVEFHLLLGRLVPEFMRRAGRVYTAKGHGLSLTRRNEKKKSKEITEEVSTSTDDKILKIINEEQKKMKDEFMLLCETVPVLKNLSVERQRKLIEAMTFEIHYPNAPIVIEGEEADKFYVLKSGTVTVALYQGAGKPLNEVNKYSSADYFGEMSFIKNEPRTAYIIAKTPVHVYALKKADFYSLLGDQIDAFVARAQKEYEQSSLKTELKQIELINAKGKNKGISNLNEEVIKAFLRNVPVISELSDDELTKATELFKIKSFSSREVIISEGSQAKHFYIIYQGMVSIQKAPEEAGMPHKKLGMIGAGKYLGEIAFINEQPRTAFCIAETDVILLAMSRSDFMNVFGHLTNSFLMRAEGSYMNCNEEMPDWLSCTEKEERKNVDDDVIEEDVSSNTFCRNDKLSNSIENEKAVYEKKKQSHLASDSKKAKQMKKGNSSIESGDAENCENKADSRHSSIDKSIGDHSTVSENQPRANQSVNQNIQLSSANCLELQKENTAESALLSKNDEQTISEDACTSSVSSEDFSNSNSDKVKKGKKESKSSKKETKKKKKEEAEKSKQNFKELFLIKIKEKYGSIAHAFKIMNADENDFVDLSKFILFVSSLDIQAQSNEILESLFAEFCYPEKDKLFLPNLYVNAEEKSYLTHAELNLRLVEIYGSAKNAFLKKTSLSEGSTCKMSDFLNVAISAGLNKINATELWRAMDRLQNSQMKLKNVLGFLSTELSLEEIEKSEKEAFSLFGRVLSIFTDEKTTENEAKQKENEKDSELSDEFEDPIILQRDDHRTYPEECKLLHDCIEHRHPWNYLSPDQQKFLVSQAKREIWIRDSRPIAQGEERTSMGWICSGELQILHAGFFGIETSQGFLKPGDFIGEEELLNDTPAINSYLVVGFDHAIVWVLERDIFEEQIKEMLLSRQNKIPKMENLLKNVPIIKDMKPESITNIAKKCKVEKFSANQTVFKAGRPGDTFCILYSGEAVTVKPLANSTDSIELATQKKGDYFGEMAVIKNQMRSASVVAKTKLTLLSLEKDAFENLLGLVKDKMVARAQATYLRHDATVIEDEPTQAKPQSHKGRTRKSSLALIAVNKLKHQNKGAKKNEDNSVEDTETYNGSRWYLAPDVEVIHTPPSLMSQPKRSCLRGNKEFNSRAVSKSVSFNEETLLPSLTLDDD